MRRQRGLHEHIMTISSARLHTHTCMKVRNHVSAKLTDINQQNIYIDLEEKKTVNIKQRRIT